MFRKIGWIFIAALSVVVGYSKWQIFIPNHFLVTREEETKKFLSWEGIESDQIWIPQEKEVEAVQKNLRALIQNCEGPKDGRYFNRDYILSHISEYFCEYSGFTHGGEPYIVCNMFLYIGDARPAGYQGFSIIMDGGCGVVCFVLDVRAWKIVKIACNGVA